MSVWRWASVLELVSVSRSELASQLASVWVKELVSRLALALPSGGELVWAGELESELVLDLDPRRRG